MQSWKLLIEYDGTRYHGWQRQPNTRTVQGELERAASNLVGTRVDIGGAGRTDAGVHAVGQVAHFQFNSVEKFDSKRILYGLNDALPSDINILKAGIAAPDFHARRSAVERRYVYQISTRRTAFGKQYVWWIKDRLDVQNMAKASQMLVGRHDFRSFTERDGEKESTIVHVSAAQMAVSGNLILFRIGASHFLWKMVRRIVGALAQVGRGKLSLSEFERLLVVDSNDPAPWTAPPSGLFLEQVLYENAPPPTTLVPVFPVR